MQESEDQLLVRGAQAGDRLAFDRLMLKYRERVLRLTLRYTHNRSDAEDAAQEAFMLAYRGMRRFRGECAFYTWLHRISVNSAKNLLAARARQRAPSWDGWEDERSSDPIDTATPEHLAVTEEIFELVNAAVEALPEEQRVAVMLRELEGYNYEAIATTMAFPIGTVRSRIFRARELIDQRLRQVFEDGLGHERARLTKA